MAKRSRRSFRCSTATATSLSRLSVFTSTSRRVRLGEFQFCFHRHASVHQRGVCRPARPELLQRRRGRLGPGTEEWVAPPARRWLGSSGAWGCRDPRRAPSEDPALAPQALRFFPHGGCVRLALVGARGCDGSAVAAGINDWVLDYCASDRTRSFRPVWLALVRASRVDAQYPTRGQLASEFAERSSAS